MTPIKKQAFVTGGNGKIGRHLVSLLLTEQYDVKVLTRSGNVPWHKKSGVKVIKGDLLDKDILMREILKDSYVFHLAVHQDVSDSNRENFFRTNVLGTEILLETCLGKKVKKLVCVSSIVIFKNTKKTKRNEKWSLRDLSNHDHYATTKLEALISTRKFYSNNKDALPLVTVFPSMVVDVDDFNASAPTTVPFLQRFLWEKVGGGVPGGIINLIGKGRRIINYVLMEDLVKGLLLAAEKGGSGEEYILGGTNITAKNYLKLMVSRRKKKVFPFRIPVFPFKIIFLFIHIFKPPPIITIIAHSLSRDCFFSSKKAISQLGYNPKGQL
jgi:dihydroflavonol-4-reductase/farnesol dehydrogenase